VDAPNYDATLKENRLSFHDETLKKVGAGAATDRMPPLPGQLHLEKTLSGGVGSQHEGLQKIIQQMLPTELLSRTTGQDRK
jgi:hypothetical protein